MASQRGIRAGRAFVELFADDGRFGMATSDPQESE